MAEDDKLMRVDGGAELARVELSLARARLQHATRALKAEVAQDLAWLRLPAKVTSSVKRQPLLWVGGAFAVGALLGFFSTRRDHGIE